MNYCRLFKKYKFGLLSNYWLMHKSAQSHPLTTIPNNTVVKFNLHPACQKTEYIQIEIIFWKWQSWGIVVVLICYLWGFVFCWVFFPPDNDSKDNNNKDNHTKVTTMETIKKYIFCLDGYLAVVGPTSIFKVLRY